MQPADYEPDAGALMITGKGNRQRLVYATGGGKEAIEAWLARISQCAFPRRTAKLRLADRGDYEGALLPPVNKGGAV